MSNQVSNNSSYSKVAPGLKVATTIVIASCASFVYAPKIASTALDLISGVGVAAGAGVAGCFAWEHHVKPLLSQNTTKWDTIGSIALGALSAGALYYVNAPAVLCYFGGVEGARLLQYYYSQNNSAAAQPAQPAQPEAQPNPSAAPPEAQPDPSAAPPEAQPQVQPAQSAGQPEAQPAQPADQPQVPQQPQAQQQPADQPQAQPAAAINPEQENEYLGISKLFDPVAVAQSDPLEDDEAGVFPEEQPLANQHAENPHPQKVQQMPAVQSPQVKSNQQPNKLKTRPKDKPILSFSKAGSIKTGGTVNQIANNQIESSLSLTKKFSWIHFRDTALEGTSIKSKNPSMLRAGFLTFCCAIPIIGTLVAYFSKTAQEGLSSKDWGKIVYIPVLGTVYLLFEEIINGWKDRQLIKESIKEDRSFDTLAATIKDFNTAIGCAYTQYNKKDQNTYTKEMKAANNLKDSLKTSQFKNKQLATAVKRMAEEAESIIQKMTK